MACDFDPCGARDPFARPPPPPKRRFPVFELGLLAAAGLMLLLSGLFYWRRSAATAERVAVLPAPVADRQERPAPLAPARIEAAPAGAVAPSSQHPDPPQRPSASKPAPRPAPITEPATGTPPRAVADATPPPQAAPDRPPIAGPVEASGPAITHTAPSRGTDLAVRPAGPRHVRSRRNFLSTLKPSAEGLSPVSAAPAKGPASATPPATAPREDSARQPASPGARPGVATGDPRIDPFIAEAWGLIERGDHEPGRRRLLQAPVASPDEIRIEFSLGLLAALVDRDWAAAEEHFKECVRRRPNEAASLNNLAAARVRTGRLAEALADWEAALARDPRAEEIVQNLGRFRHLVKSGRIPKKPALAEKLEELYTKAAVGSGRSFQPTAGFQYMALRLADGRTVGWADAAKYEDGWCFACKGSGQVDCPNPACVRGMVRLPRSQGRGRESCESCQGRGVTQCPACIRGRDRELKWSPKASATPPPAR